jgi:hypothetical protein
MKSIRIIAAGLLVCGDREEMKSTKIIAALLAVALLAGCRSHMATIRLSNSSAEPISTIIVDYPSATFGKDKLAPHETFSSSVKVTDTGALKVQFTDAKGVHHSYTGPVLHPNAGNDIEIRLTQESATAEVRL